MKKTICISLLLAASVSCYAKRHDFNINFCNETSDTINLKFKEINESTVNIGEIENFDKPLSFSRGSRRLELESSNCKVIRFQTNKTSDWGVKKTDDIKIIDTDYPDEFELNMGLQYQGGSQPKHHRYFIDTINFNEQLEKPYSIEINNDGSQKGLITPVSHERIEIENGASSDGVQFVFKDF